MPARRNFLQFSVDTHEERNDKIVIDYISMNNLSFNHLTHPTSKLFAEKRIKLKGDKYYRSVVLDKAYNGAKHELCKLLEDASHVSCTTDIWSNEKGSLMRCYFFCARFKNTQDSVSLHTRCRRHTFEESTVLIVRRSLSPTRLPIFASTLRTWLPHGRV